MAPRAKAQGKRAAVIRRRWATQWRIPRADPTRITGATTRAPRQLAGKGCRLGCPCCPRLAPCRRAL
eukprot:11157947-Lingulodinium_polyedra.AAC.1